MKRIIVIGSPGAGKSTFSRKLRDITGLPLYYLDMLWHKPDKTNISEQEFDRRLEEILGKERWIIDGNYHRTLVPRLIACDTVFLLDFPVEVCLSGAKERIGKKREDMPWTETELDGEFKRFIEDFPVHKLPEIYSLLDKYRESRETVIFRSRSEAEEYLSMLRR